MSYGNQILVVEFTAPTTCCQTREPKSVFCRCSVALITRLLPLCILITTTHFVQFPAPYQERKSSRSKSSKSSPASSSNTELLELQCQLGQLDAWFGGGTSTSTSTSTTLCELPLTMGICGAKTKKIPHTLMVTLAPPRADINVYRPYGEHRALLYFHWYVVPCW